MKLIGFAVLVLALMPLALGLGVLVALVTGPAIAMVVAAECVEALCS